MTGSRPPETEKGSAKGRRRHGIAAVLTAALFLASAVGCPENAFYAPTQVVYHEPADYGLRAEPVIFQSQDGVRLRGAIFPSAGKSLGVVVYFHGNYGNVTHYVEQFHWLPKNGFTIFAFDYRGYGSSDGSPSRRGLHKDGLAALAFARTHPLLGPQDRFVFGQSLGGAVAVPAVAASEDAGIRAVVVEGTFHSYRKEAQEMMAHTVREKWKAAPCLGFQTAVISGLTVSDAMRPSDHIEQISPIPVLIVHCAGDRTVRPAHARRLYDAASEPKTLWMVDDRDHMGIFGPKAADKRYRNNLIHYLKQHLSK